MEEGGEDEQAEVGEVAVQEVVHADLLKGDAGAGEALLELEELETAVVDGAVGDFDGEVVAVFGVEDHSDWRTVGRGLLRRLFVEFAHLQEVLVIHGVMIPAARHVEEPDTQATNQGEGEFAAQFRL